MNRRIVGASLTAAAIAGLTGCKTAQNNPSQLGGPATQPVAQTHTIPTTQPTPPADTGTASALVAKTQAWAREMEPLISKRVKEPSVVEFLDPSEFRLGPADFVAPKKRNDEPQVIAISNPVIEHTPSIPNQGASIKPAVNPPKLVADSQVDRAAVPAKDTSIAAGDLEFTLNRQMKDNPKDVWAHLDYQLLQFLKDKQSPQMDVMARLSGEDRELLTSVIDGLANFRNTLRADNNMLISRKVKPLLDMADRVRSQADLIIPTVSLCSRVDGFGVYEPMEPRFPAMKEQAVIIYCEVENFASQLNDKKMWETRLSQEVVLYTESGLPVWQDKTEQIPDFARRRRHDFFVVKKARLPANITIGRYLLKVTIVDQQANRVAEATVPVQFVAQ